MDHPAQAAAHYAALLWISQRALPADRCVIYRPPEAKIALGLGCDRNTPIATLRATIKAGLAVCRERLEDVVAVGGITLKCC